MKRWQYRQTRVSRLLVWLLVLAQMMVGLAAAPAAYADGPAATRTVTIPQVIGEAADWIVSQGPVTDDWYAYTLAAAGRTVESGYVTAAAGRVGSYTNQTMPTAYAKTALGVKAAGGDPTAIGGVNLLAPLYSRSDLPEQGTNAVIYGLLALDSGSYTIPGDAPWSGGKLADWLTAHQRADGGWALFASSTESDVDLTGAALWALAPYKERSGVAQAVNQAVAWLAAKQLDNGDLTADRSNSNSLAMMVLGLSMQQKDSRQGSFAKADGDLITALLRYISGDGGFAYKVGSAADGFSTYQALLALVAYNTLTGGQSGTFEVPAASSSTTGKAAVSVHIEKPGATMAAGTELASTPLEALQLVAARNGLDVATSETPFFDVTRIGDVEKYVNGPAYYYWAFKIKRNGQWTNDWNWQTTELENGDEIAIFYGPIDASALLDSMELNPPAPKNHTPFTVKVTQFSGGQSVTAAVYVQVGDRKVWTDASGVAAFPDGLAADDQEVRVSGALVDGFPTVISGSRKLPPNVKVRVEGPQSTLDASAAERGTNVFEAVANTVTSVVYTDGMFFSVDAIDGLTPSGYSWWGFALKRDGVWIPTDAWNTTGVREGDEVLAYYSGLDTQLVSSIATVPLVPKAGQSFAVKVKKQDWQGIVTSAAGVSVKIGSVTKQTNADGQAVFDGLPAGAYDIAVTGYQSDDAPTVVRAVSTVTVTSAAGGEQPQTAAVTLSVHGGANRGEIVTPRSVAYTTGDTAYSLLVKALGADRVEASGTGANVYVSGIDGLYEFDNGPQSGWMYAVNCTFPSASAGNYTLHNGDKLAWRYTLNGGDDVKAAELPGCGAPGMSSGAGPDKAAIQPIDDAVKGLGIAYDNRKPASLKMTTLVIQNAGAKMDAAAVQQLKELIAANAVELNMAVDPAVGATLADANGEVMLSIPGHALGASRTVSVHKLQPDASRSEVVSSIFEFGPNGTTFDKPIYLAVKAPVDTDQPEQLALVWLDEATGRWIPIPAVLDAQTGVFTGTVNHFTKFAVIDKSKLEPAVKTQPVNVAAAVQAAADYVAGHAQLTDWEAYGLAVADRKVPAAYLASVDKLLQDKSGSLRNVTDYERLAIGVQAAGGDPQDVAGYDLLQAVFNNERMTVQGTNGPIFALVAAHTSSYAIPADSVWTEAKLLEWLLAQQNSDGGWPLAPGDGSNVDLTGMALVALAPYQERSGVERAVERALGWLSGQQQADGGFALSGEANSESAAQVLLALTALKLDVAGDARFVKNGANVVGALLRYQQADGGFAHAKGQESGGIATEQALLALAQYAKLTEQTVPGTSYAGYADAADISAWAADYVRKATVYGLMEGVEAQMFAPQATLTRAQFVAMMLRLEGEQPAAAGAAQTFIDVPADSWYFGYIEKAQTLGLVDGLGGGIFAPNRAVSRQEMALVLARAFALTTPAPAGAEPFRDLGEALPDAVSAIGAVYAGGYMEGDEQGRFLPRAFVTREMAAAVVVRAYEKQQH